MKEEDFVVSGLLFEDVPLTLTSGQTLRGIQVAYTINGRLDSRAGVILITHALTGDQYVCETNVKTGKYGWWSEYVGSGKVIDTDKYCVICTNVLGGCMGTTGPSTHKEDGTGLWGAEFPVITIEDMVNVQREFLTNIGVNHLYAIVGGSMGGMQVLEWLRKYPDAAEKYLVIASSYRQPVQNIGFHEIGRRAILLDPLWKGGQYEREKVSPEMGLAVARMISHMTYLSPEALSKKFGRRLQDRNEKTYSIEEEDEFQIESYLNYQGVSFTDRFDANSYLYITKAVDYFDQSEDYAGDLVEAYSKITGLRGKVVDLISFSSDWLYPPTEMEAIYDALMKNGGRCKSTIISSPFGHDSFLVKNENLERQINKTVL